MEKFRNLTQNLFFKIFLGFVALSFVTFGVGDFIFGNSKSWIAKIAKKEISYNEFLSNVRDARNRIYRINPSQEVLQYLNSNNFKFQILNDLITKKYVDIIQEDFSLYPDQELILKEITNESSFIAEDGKFDRNLFINYLQQSNINEKEFIDSISSDVANNIIKNSLRYYQINNSKIVEEIYKYQNQKRKVNIIEIALNKIPQKKNLTNKDLEAFFAKNEEKFSLPELRNISYISFDAQDIIPDVKINNQEIILYHQNSSDYNIESAKDFYHILFDDKLKAEKFLKQLNNTDNKNVANNFLKLAQDSEDKSKNDLLMKNIKKSDLLPQMQEQVFQVKLNQVSKIITSDLGFHIFYTAKESKAEKKPLDSKLKSEIRKKLANDKKEQILASKIEEIDDLILTTNSLKDIAKINKNIKVKIIQNIDAKGNNTAGNNLINSLKLSNFIENSFNLPENEASEIFYSKSNNKYYAVTVNKISAARSRELSEVRNEVKNLLLKERRLEDLNEFANKIHQDLSSGKSSLAKISQNRSINIKYNNILAKNNIKNNNINFMAVVFDADDKSFTKPYFDQDKNIIRIAQIRKIIIPKTSKKSLEEFRKKLSNSFTGDVLNNYYNIYLQNKYPVQINYKLLEN
ncbi:SurA N-terminal domain-containing protein [Rickettsiales bacterium]|nr:SurA N-terminal domain-containing protein [Rickettsiales bacterium]